jgi:hypothetical protein
MKMITREKAREITEKVIETENNAKIEKAKNFVETEVDRTITEYAKMGKDVCTIFIPSHIDKKTVISLIEGNGFKVKGEFAYAEFEISW